METYLIFPFFNWNVLRRVHACRTVINGEKIFKILAIWWASLVLVYKLGRQRLPYCSPLRVKG